MITAAEIAGDTTAFTEFNGLIDTDVKSLKQTRVEDVAETGKLSFNGFLEWFTARTRWFGGIQVASAWN